MHETVSLHFEPPFHFYFLCRIWEERACIDKIVGLINSFGQLGLQILICFPNPVDSSSFLMLRKTEGKRRWGPQRMKWLDGITNSMVMVWENFRRQWRTGKPGVLQSMGLQSCTRLSDRTTTIYLKQTDFWLGWTQARCSPPAVEFSSAPYTPIKGLFFT